MRRLIVATATLVALAGSALAGPNEDAMMSADIAFNEMAQKQGVAEAFAAFAAPDARMFRGEEKIVSGPAEIRELMAAQYDHGGTLTWAPKEAVASADGTMGFTHGRWTYTTPPAADGKTQALQGSYVSIWSKQPDGAYKFALDIGTPDRAQEGQE